MNEKLTEKSCLAFAGELASSAPVPGGGGAAALTGALGAALGAMAGRLTADKPSFSSQAEEIKALVLRAEALGQELLRLVDADAEGFFPLSRAYSLPKGDPSRAEVLRRATLTACTAPVRMVEVLADCVALLEALRNNCSKLMLSDLGCAAALCGGALEAAAMNVYVNTRSLPEDGEAWVLKTRTARLLEEYRPRARRLSEEITAILMEE